MLEAALTAGLTHDQFWDLTVHEVLLALRAHERRCLREKQLLAWVQVNVLRGLLGRKAPSMNRLMGYPSLMGRSNKEIKEHYRRKAAAV